MIYDLCPDIKWSYLFWVWGFTDVMAITRTIITHLQVNMVTLLLTQG